MTAIFEYMYRDAGNFKAFGYILLAGSINGADDNAIRAKLPLGELFVAEQIGIPTLYEKLYVYSNGPTFSDHCWHTFVALRQVDSEAPLEAPIWGDANQLLAKLNAIEAWDEGLSPHFGIGWST